MGNVSAKTASAGVSGSTDPALGTLFNAMGGYELYNAEIESFFRENFVYRSTLHRKERFATLNSFGRDTVVYLHRGRLKNYIANPAGQEVFLGFMPQHSTISTMRGGYDLGKGMTASTDCSIYIATNDSYLQFLQSSPALIEHQLLEPYYRRNLNDFPKIETMFYPTQVKVYEYVLYLVTLFGKPDPQDAGSLTMMFPPSIKDIASYLGIHRSNASRYLSQLEKESFVEHSPKQLTVHNAAALSNEIEALKNAHLEK